MTGGNRAGHGRLTVWVAGWQQERCGDDWAIGSSVSWTLAAPDSDYLDPLFAREASVLVDRAEEHHGGLPDDAPRTAGSVVAIHGVQLRYAPTPDGDSTTLYPVAGSASRTPLAHSNGDEFRRDGFAGYLVEIET
jgi:hypothetical protein